MFFTLNQVYDHLLHLLCETAKEMPKGLRDPWAVPGIKELTSVSL